MGLTIGDQIALVGVAITVIVVVLSFLRKPTIISASRASELLATIAELRSENADLRSQVERCNTLLNQFRDENRYLERRLRTFEDRGSSHDD